MKALIAITALALSFSGCATYFQFFGVKSGFFTAAERALLDKTTAAIEFDYGFDPDIMLEYVYPTYQGFTTFKSDEKKFQKTLKDLDGPALAAYSEKLYRLRALYRLRLKQYEKEDDWKDHTYLEKYLIPALDHYRDLIDRLVDLRNPGYAGSRDERREMIDRELKKEKERQDFDDIWKDDYTS